MMIAAAGVAVVFFKGTARQIFVVIATASTAMMMIAVAGVAALPLCVWKRVNRDHNSFGLKQGLTRMMAERVSHFQFAAAGPQVIATASIATKMIVAAGVHSGSL